MKKPADLVVDFFFPKCCAICSKPGRLICTDCLSDFESARLKCMRCLKHNPLGLYCPSCSKDHLPDRVIAAFRYDGAPKELIHQMKYGDFHELAEEFGARLAKQIRRIVVSTDSCVSFVPIHRSKKKYRGYNQSEILAQAIARRLKLDCRELLLKKCQTPSQTEFDTAGDRRRNVKGVFVAIQTIPKRIILIDDVITSGATIEEAARVLKKAGAKKVIAVSIALG